MVSFNSDKGFCKWLGLGVIIKWLGKQYSRVENPVFIAVSALNTMRALIQRVSKASVSVSGRLVGQIGRGFVVLLGITHTDSEIEAKWLANKIASLRVFEDQMGKMNLSLFDVEGSVLVVSQFTLYGDVSEGRRPSFVKAAEPKLAEPLVTYFASQLRQRGLYVETGVFGALMQVEIYNDGPVTMMLEK